MGVECRRPDVASISGSCCPVRFGGAGVQVAFFRQVTRFGVGLVSLRLIGTDVLPQALEGPES
jgi:hypothetical protein